MNDLSAFTDFRKVQRAMEHLGFAHAASALYERWGIYSDREREIIKAKWYVS